jgi:hypothetical protein
MVSGRNSLPSTNLATMGFCYSTLCQFNGYDHYMICVPMPQTALPVFECHHRFARRLAKPKEKE